MDRAVFAIYRTIARAIGLLPLRAVFRIGWALGTLAYYIAGPYRRLVLRNLGIAFGTEKKPGELRELARRHFATLGANLFASIKLPTLSRAEIESVVSIEGIEHLRTGAAGGNGFLMVISHLGNWEMFAQLSPIAFPCKVGTIYQALGNPHIDAEVRRDRARLGLALFERKEGFIAAGKFLRDGGAVGVLIDQHAGDGGLWCPLFNRLASTSTLAATLAQRAGALLIPAAVHTDGVARWRCVIGAPVAPATTTDATTARLNQILESQIRRAPADWFWVHNRWKLPQPKFLLATYKRGVFVPDGESTDLQLFRIVIRSPNWLGDAAMCAPAVLAIKRGRPDCHVTVLAPAKLADFWRAMPEVDQVIAIERGEGVFAVAKKLRGRFEAAVIFPNSPRTGLEAWLAGIPRRVGYPGHRRRWLLSQVWQPKKRRKGEAPPPPRHQVYHYLRLAEFIGAEPEATAAPFAITPKIAPLPIRIALCPGAEYGPAKRWLPERFTQTMLRVSAECDVEWILVGVAKDSAIGEQILEGFSGKYRNLIGQTTLAQLVEELRACRLLLTNDTGTMHLAAHFGVPTVAIFGSTEPALTGPLGTGHRVIRHHVACSPCFLRECPIDFRCMKAVEVEEIVHAIHAILGTGD